MNFEQCKATLAEIRRRQGTERPMVQVMYDGAMLRGRLRRADTDQPERHNARSPYGVIVLEQPGLFPGPPTFVQIANIPDDGIREVGTRTELAEAREKLVEANSH